MHRFLPTIRTSLPSLLTRASEASQCQALLPPGSGSALTAQPSGSRRPWLFSAPELQLPAGFVSHHLPLSALPAGRGQVAAGLGPMGARSRGEGGGEEEGGGLWAAAPFIATAGRAGVLCFRSYGGANSCYQQAPGRLQHCGRRYHPVASDRRGGNAGERRGRHRPGPEPGARAWSGLRQRTLPGQSLRPVAGGHGLVPPGSPGSAASAAPGCVALGLGIGAWLEARGGAGVAGLAGLRGGVGEGRAGRRNWSPWGSGAVFPAGRCFQGHLGDARGTRGALARGGAASPFWVGFRAAGCFISLLALLRGCGVSFGTARWGLRRPLAPV